MYQDLVCTKPQASVGLVNGCCGSKVGKKGTAWASTKQAARRRFKSKRKRTPPGYGSCLCSTVYHLCTICEHTLVVQVGANRSQITSEKWWEGAFNSALNIVNHEVRSESTSHPQGMDKLKLWRPCRTLPQAAIAMCPRQMRSQCVLETAMVPLQVLRSMSFKLQLS